MLNVTDSLLSGQKLVEVPADEVIFMKSSANPWHHNSISAPIEEDDSKSVVSLLSKSLSPKLSPPIARKVMSIALSKTMPSLSVNDAGSSIATDLVIDNHSEISGLRDADDFSVNSLVSNLSDDGFNNSSRDHIGSMSGHHGIASTQKHHSHHKRRNLPQRSMKSDRVVYKEKALYFMSDSDLWSSLWKSKKFCDAFSEITKRKHALQVKYRVDVMLQWSSCNINDKMLIELIAMALHEYEQLSRYEVMKKDYKNEQHDRVNHFLVNAMSTEAKRARKVEGLAERTQRSKIVLGQKAAQIELWSGGASSPDSIHGGGSVDSIAQSKVSLSTQDSRTVYENSMSEKKQFRERKRVRDDEKHNVVLSKHLQHLERMEKAEQVRQQAKELAKLKTIENSNMSLHHEVLSAKNHDQEFRVKAAQHMKMLEDRSVAHMERLKCEKLQLQETKKLEKEIAIIRAEQLRRMNQNDTNAKLAMFSEELRRLDVQKEISDSISGQRVNVLQQVYYEKLHAPIDDAASGNGDSVSGVSSSYASITESINTTPGPGDYDSGKSASYLAKKPKGGFMGVRYEHPVDTNTPGPGQYVVQNPEYQRGKGAVPFIGRGKSNVDLILADKSKIPGPNEYNAPIRQLPGGKFSQFDTPNFIGMAIRTKGYVPGPGSYNTSGTVTINSLQNIIKTNNLQDFRGKVPDEALNKFY